MTLLTSLRLSMTSCTCSRSLTLKRYSSRACSLFVDELVLSMCARWDTTFEQSERRSFLSAAYTATSQRKEWEGEGNSGQVTGTGAGLGSPDAETAGGAIGTRGHPLLWVTYVPGDAPGVPRTTSPGMGRQMGQSSSGSANTVREPLLACCRWLTTGASARGLSAPGLEALAGVSFPSLSSSTLSGTFRALLTTPRSSLLSLLFPSSSHRSSTQENCVRLPRYGPRAAAVAGMGSPEGR
mmetsp:Transcript_20749/g.41503  ORF Transcript_20749/g.41503 Transcript_20749/m.41503 type:complete len:239 (-) Transcript_20749:1784-2500(-)